METWQDNSKMVLSKLDRLEKKFDSIEDKINNINVNIAVHEVKLGRSSAFFGAISGLIVAVLTGVIINYVAAPVETKQPRVIYKEEPQKIIENDASNTL